MERISAPPRPGRAIQPADTSRHADGAVAIDGTRMRVLFVEDDPEIAASVRDGLQRHGFDVDILDRGRPAIEQGHAFDVVLFDPGLPDIDGVDVCHKLRSTSAMSIVVVSASDDELDRVVGLEVGAHDYVSSRSACELIATIKAVTRRSAHPAGNDDAHDGAMRLGAGGRRAHPAGVGGRTRGHADPKEFDLLAVLVAEPGVVLRRAAARAGVGT